MPVASEEALQDGPRLPELAGEQRAASQQRARPDDQCSQQRSRSLSVNAGNGGEQWSTLAMMESELQSLRPAVTEASERRKWLLEELEKAKVTEAEEKKNLADSKVTQAERRARLRERFQKAVKGFMYRRRIIAALNHEMESQLARKPLLPQQLRSQLEALQQCTHGLMYQAKDRHGGATRIQAWWRGTLGRRMVVCIRSVNSVWKTVELMRNAALKIQSWYRSASTKKKWRGRIRLRMQMRQEQQFVEQEQQLRRTIQLQRAVRARLARKKVQAEKARMKSSRARAQDMKEEEMGEHGENLKWRDSWRDKNDPDAAKVIEGAMPRDLELEKIREVGLIPFYSSYATAQIRHRIGGPVALKMQRQLGVGVGALSKGEVPDKLLEECLESSEEQGRSREEAKKRTFTTQDDINNDEAALGGDWDVYPEGLSKCFLDRLEDDVFRRRQQKSQPKMKPEKRKQVSSRPPPPPPAHTRSRAVARHASLEAAEEAAAAAEAAKAIAHLEHPLLEGLLPHVPLQPLPPSAPPTGRRRPAAIGRRDLEKGRGYAGAETRAAEESEEEGWGGLTGFYGEVAKKPNRGRSADCRSDGNLMLPWEASDNKFDADPSLTAREYPAF